MSNNKYNKNHKQTNYNKPETVQETVVKESDKSPAIAAPTAHATEAATPLSKELKSEPVVKTAPKVEDAVIKQVEASTDVYLRKDPSSKAERIKIVKKGESLAILSVVNDWSKVKTSFAEYGYVMTKYTKDVE